MTKTTTWLLAGAALALCAGGAVAAIAPEDAARQAEADSRAAAAEARAAIQESREAAREARERARKAREEARERSLEAAEMAREAGERAREAGQQAREAAREAVRHARLRGDFVRGYHHGGEGRAAYLTRALQLRPDQQPALEAFLEATRRERSDHTVRFDGGRDDGRTTLQRLDDMQARIARQQADASHRIAAVRTFYGQLDATQRKAFDSMPILMVVGPSVGPMMLPGPMPVVHMIPPVPPVPPAPPVPPRL